MTENNINFSLSKDEALVLFEFLSRFSNTDKLHIEDQAEEKVLWRLTGVFEKVLSEPFSKDYETQLNEARERLRDKLE